MNKRNLSFLSVCVTYADNTLTGTVTEVNGEAITGANLIWLGSSVGTSTIVRDAPNDYFHVRASVVWVPIHGAKGDVGIRFNWARN